MARSARRVVPSELDGVGEDPDFVERFRRDRARRWLRGIRNGMSAGALLGYRLGLSPTLRFHGVAVRQSDNQATLRLIEDIWMRGEYDLPGFVPGSGWRVVDVGANVGIYAMLCASRGAVVRAYEPAPEAFARLEANTARWGVACRRAAVVGAPRPSATLYLHPLRDTRNTLFGPEGGAGTVEVPALAIAEVLDTPCDLLKIDCEGAEFELVAHAGEALRMAARIILEVDVALQGPHGGVEELVARIRAAGFDVALGAPHPGMTYCLLTATRRSPRP